MASKSKISSIYYSPTTKEELAYAKKKRLFLVALATISFIVFGLLVYNNFINLHPKQVGPEVLRSFAARLEYTLRYQSLLVSWLMFCVLFTIYGRLTSKALNPLDERTEEQVQIYKNILQNSLETIVISVFSQFAFISFAEPATILKVIPFINVTLLISRIFYFLGYPTYRAFGYFFTLLANNMLVFYNLFKMGAFFGIY